MWVWYNDRLIKEKDLTFHPSNRAFQYGDGIFETMIIKDGELQHASYHEARINYSLKILHLDFKLTFEELIERVRFLLAKNKLQNTRAKLTIWRAPGGYYIPDNNDSEFLITVTDYQETPITTQFVALSKEICIPSDITKNCKTLNALPFILAGLELRKYPELTDLILLNREGYVSECISSNLFWIKDGKYYTPSLSSNCIMGVKRAYIIDELGKRGTKVNEVLVTPDELKKADHVFKTNVTGIFPIGKIDEQAFETSILLEEQ